MSLQTKITQLAQRIRDQFNVINPYVRLREMRFGGRIYFYADRRWVTVNNNYGHQNINQSQSGGTNAEPDKVWSHRGIPLKAGTVLKQYDFLMRGNNTTIGNVDIFIATNRGDYNNAYDNNSETIRDVIFNGTMTTSPSNDKNWAKVDLGDYEVEHDCELMIYWRANNVPNSTRYGYYDSIITYLIAE